MLWFNFARRYMFSPKSHSVINIIAMVSVIAIAVPTAATIILLSMFGGLDRTVRDIYATADADIEITSTKGELFLTEGVNYEAISSIEGVESYTSYIEQSVMIASTSNRMAVTLRGVDDSYTKVLTADDHLIGGSFDNLKQGDIIAGATIASTLNAYALGADVELYALNGRRISSLLPAGGISRVGSHIGGVCMANAELDAKLVLMDITKAQELLNNRGKITHIAIDIDADANEKRICQELKGIMGDTYSIRTREEKNASLSEIMKLEKFIILLIGCFIALIATFAIVGTIVMLITEKRRDIATFQAMGANNTLIRRIFVGEGLLLTLCGTLLGTLLGVGFCLLQQHYGIVGIEGNMVIEHYPVAIDPYDITLVALIMVGIGWLISKLTVRATLKRYR